MLRSRGLGPERLSAFLHRNAGLRALVGEDFDADDAEVDLAVRVRAGPAVRARVLVVRTDREAAALRRDLADPDGRADPVRFGVAATERSTHATGDRGGLVERLSPDDPGWPASVRDAARTLESGRLSEVLAVEGGYALLLVESSLPPLAQPDDEGRRAVRREIVEGKQRAAMEALARTLVSASRVTAFDASLRWAWEGPAPAR